MAGPDPPGANFKPSGAFRCPGAFRCQSVMARPGPATHDFAGRATATTARQTKHGHGASTAESALTERQATPWPLTMPDPIFAATRVIWRGNLAEDGVRLAPRETPVALTYNRVTHAVMLASPADLKDFAIGFSLSEGIIAKASDIRALDIVEVPDGIECRMDLADDRLDALTKRQRRLAGPSGCGLCGLDSLAAAIRPAPHVASGRMFTPAMIQEAMRAMPAAQAMNSVTRAVHAAAFWTQEHGLVALREDVGRHNALDKLSGALARANFLPMGGAPMGVAPMGGAAVGGLVLLSSRVSVEMVQKAATMGAPVIVAVSAPTSLAIEVANAAGITLIGVARADGFEVFTHPNRINLEISCNVPG